MPRQRRPALAALALLLIVGGALGAAYLVVQSGQRVAAIEIDRPVGAGQRIPLNAMRSVQIAAGAGLGYVPWDQADQVSRYYAATAIPAGTLLSSAMVARASDLAAGKAVLGLALKDGQLPVGLQVGDHVEVFQVSNSTQACPGAPGGTLAPDAVVLGISVPPADSGSQATDVEVALDPADAGQVACNAANGSVGVAELPSVPQPATASPAPTAGQPSGRAAPKATARRRSRPANPAPGPTGGAAPAVGPTVIGRS